MNKSLGLYNLIDLDGINDSIKRVVSSDVNFNTYVSPKGLKELRVTIANFLRDTWNYDGSYKNILITSGSQQSINLIVYSIINDGDTILVEQPTYFGAIDVFKNRKLKQVGINIWEDGFNLEELEEKIIEYKVKAIYVTPTFNNPTGYAWSNEARRAFLDIVNKYDVLVIEDDPYRLINFTDYEYRTLYEMNNGNNVIYLGTFSKLISPAINVGYIACNEKYMDYLYAYKNSFDLCTSAFLQYIVLDYLANNDLMKIITLKKKIYKKLLNKSLEHIKDNYQVVNYTRSKGGLFYQVVYKNPVNEKEYENLNKYYITGEHKNETRVNICSFLDKL